MELTKQEMEERWASAHTERLNANREDLINFFDGVNSAFASQMAEDAVRIEAWKVEGTDEPFKVPDRPENVQTVHQLRGVSFENSWVRLLFHYADGKTASEDFWNGN